MKNSKLKAMEQSKEQIKVGSKVTCDFNGCLVQWSDRNGEDEEGREFSDVFYSCNECGFYFCETCLRLHGCHTP